MLSCINYPLNITAYRNQANLGMWSALRDGEVQAQFHLHHRSSPGISQDWPLVIQFSAQMALAGCGERRELCQGFNQVSCLVNGMDSCSTNELRGFRRQVYKEQERDD